MNYLVICSFLWRARGRCAERGWVLRSSVTTVLRRRGFECLVRAGKMQYMLGCKASALAREDSASFLLEQDWTARPCLHFPRVRRR